MHQDASFEMVFSHWEHHKTIPHGRKLLGAYFKAYFGWKNDGQLPETLKPKKHIFLKNGWKPSQTMRLDALIIFLIE